MFRIHVCVSTFFFFKQKTAYDMRISDWSSDVCSSDLEYVDDLLPVTRLLHVRDRAAATVGEAGFGDFLVGNGVPVVDVLWPDHAGELQFADLEVDPGLLPTDDHQVDVGQDLGHDSGDLQFDSLLAVYRAGTGTEIGRAHV